jgi:hypothetical protein
VGSRAFTIRFHITSRFDLLKMKFHKKNIFFMKLLWSHKLGGRTNILAQVDLNFFFLFVLFFIIFSFHHLIVVGWKLNFFIFLDLFYMRLSSFHDPGYEFDKLTKLIEYFFCSFFNLIFCFSITSFNIGLIWK